MAEVAEQEADIQEEYDIAVYEKERATNNEEWTRAAEHLAEVEERYNAFMDKKNTTEEALQALNDGMEDLETAYNEAKQAREEQAQYIKDEAGIDVPEFDPANGPPGLPEEETADGSEDAAAPEGGDDAAGTTDGGDVAAPEGGR